MELMALTLLICYILIFIFLIILFIKCLKNKIKWNKLFLYEIIAIIISIILMIYYNNLPRDAFSYLGEFLVSFGAIILFSISLAITIFLRFIIYLIVKKKQDKNHFS